MLFEKDWCGHVSCWAPRSGVSLLVIVRRSFLLRRCLSSPHTFSREMTCCILDAPVADFIVGNVPQVPSLASQDESCSFAAVTRTRSKLVVDKKPLSQVIQDLEVTPDGSLRHAEKG